MRFKSHVVPFSGQTQQDSRRFTCHVVPLSGQTQQDGQRFGCHVLPFSGQTRWDGRRFKPYRKTKIGRILQLAEVYAHTTEEWAPQEASINSNRNSCQGSRDIENQNPWTPSNSKQERRTEASLIDTIDRQGEEKKDRGKLLDDLRLARRRREGKR